MAEDQSYIQEKGLRRIDPALVDKFGDPNKHPEYQLTQDQVGQILKLGREMFIAHHAKDGFPIVTIHVYCLIDGEMWSTTVKGRVKAAAFRRDPRCSVCISTAGLGLPFAGGISLKARAKIVEDRAIVEQVCREQAVRYYTSPTAQDLFFRSLFTPNRIALRFDIEKTISWANIGVRRT